MEKNNPLTSSLTGFFLGTLAACVVVESLLKGSMTKCKSNVANNQHTQQGRLFECQYSPANPNHNYFYIHLFVVAVGLVPAAVLVVTKK